MEYILIVISTVFTAGIFVIRKIYQLKTRQTIVTALLYNLALAVFMFLIYIVLGGFQIHFGQYSFEMAFLLSVVNLLSLTLGLFAVKYGRLSVYTMFMMLGGMFLPLFYGLFFLSEPPLWNVFVGTALTIDALVGMTAEKKEGSTNKIFILLCITVFILNGMVSVISNAHQIDSRAIETTQFLIWYSIQLAVLSGAALFIVYIFNRIKEKGKTEKASVEHPSDIFLSHETGVIQTKQSKKNIIILIILLFFSAVLSSFGYYFQLIGAKTIDASIIYPIITGGTVLLTTLAGRIGFKEKFDTKRIVYLIVILSGTALFFF